MTDNHHSVIVIGAGQAGLAMGALLQSAGIDYLILGQEGKIGDTWRYRYDSLVLFTPRWLNRLPLDAGPPPQLDGYPDKDEVAAYLEHYASSKQLNVMLNTRVLALHQHEGSFVLDTCNGKLMADSVVIATGPFQKPYVPDFAAKLPSDILQIHTAHYRSAQQLQPGNVVVVGAGNSGAQIAVELCDTRPVHVSAGRPLSFMPQTLFGKSIFWWFQHLGIYGAHINTAVGRRLSRRPDPVIGKALKQRLKRGQVRLLSRVVDVQDGELMLAEGGRLAASNVIWATGFRSDYSWLQVANVLDSRGKPLHHRGMTEVPGLFFLGLPWQYSRKSALIGGVGDDAAHLMTILVERLAKLEGCKQQSNKGEGGQEYGIGAHIQH